MDRVKCLAKIEETIKNGRFKDTWASLSQYETPTWFRDAKFGIFIHWGVYSVPAFGNEWYPRNMYIKGTREYEHHIKTYGPHSQFGYKDFIPMFRAEKFDAGKWAELLPPRAQNMSFLSRSITTAFRCIKVSCRTGMPLRWGRAVMCLAS